MSSEQTGVAGAHGPTGRSGPAALTGRAAATGQVDEIEPDVSFEQILLALPGGLSQPQVGAAFDRILSGEVSDVQVAAFLYGLRVKGETIEEVSGIADALLRAAPPVELDAPLIDIVGTGGDRTGAISISTPASVLVSATVGAAAVVVKHGNRGASTPTGSADVIEAWGVPLDLSPEQVAEVGRRAGITFCFAPRFHAAMRFAAPARRALNLPTVMNVLGPLINPAAPGYQLVGVADPTRVELVARVLGARGSTVLVSRGHDGLDKLTVSGPTDLTLVDARAGEPTDAGAGAGAGGRVRTLTLAPEDVGLTRSPLAALRGTTPADNARRLGEVLRGRLDGPILDAVVLNAAAACVLLAGEYDDLPDRLRAQVAGCLDVVASGAAGRRLDEWVAVARQLTTGPASR